MTKFFCRSAPSTPGLLNITWGQTIRPQSVFINLSSMWGITLGHGKCFLSTIPISYYRDLARIYSQAGGCKNCPINWREKYLITFVFTLRAPKLPRPNLNIEFDVSLSSCVVASTEGATLPVGHPGLTGLDWRKWGIGNHCGLSQSIYEKVSAYPVSDFRKLHFEHILFIDKGYHEN